jgi:hypothetical protein
MRWSPAIVADKQSLLIFTGASSLRYTTRLEGQKQINAHLDDLTETETFAIK